MLKKTVLVAAPDPTLRTALTQAILTAGYAVLESATDMETVERAGLELPSLILLRLDEPGRVGWTAVKMLGDSPRTEGIPVVALAVDASEGERRKAALMGCADMIDPTPEAAVEAVLRHVGRPDSDGPVAPPRARRRRCRPRLRSGV